MLYLISGGSKSGKSALAEKIICSYELPRYYIATMEPFGSDAGAAIENHRKMRAGKGFITVERYRDISGADIPDGSAVLLECVGNLCANEMFSGSFCGEEKIISDIIRLSERMSVLAAVTSQVGDDGIAYEQGTAAYIQSLGRINAGLAAAADNVIETVFGIPVVLKGSLFI